MIRIAIVDDDKVFCGFAEQCIEEYASLSGTEIETEVFFSGEDFFCFWRTEHQFDLILLDIEFEGMDGIQAGTILRRLEHNHHVQILYISAKDTYALDLFRNRPFDFLVKPVSKEKIICALEEYINEFSMSADYYEYMLDRRKHRIVSTNILYFQSNRKKLIVATATGSIETYEKLDDVMNSKIGKKFIRIHRCYAVNPLHITEFSYDEVILTNGEHLTISRSLRQLVSERLLASEHIRILERSKTHEITHI